MADASPPVGDLDPRERFKRAFYRGLGISLPILITLVVFFFVFDLLVGLLDPAVFFLQQTVGYTEQLPDTVIAFIAVGILFVIIIVVGFVADSKYGSSLEGSLENAVSQLPGLGTIYTGVDDLSDMLIDSDTESFREVKLIEYPFESTYALAFLTAESTGVLGDAVGQEMVTVFVPMAPNPMGGFLIHLPRDRVYDVDLTVEEGVQTILSTGVTLEAEKVHDIEEYADEEEVPIDQEAAAGEPSPGATDDATSAARQSGDGTNEGAGGNG